MTDNRPTTNDTYLAIVTRQTNGRTNTAKYAALIRRKLGRVNPAEPLAAKLLYGAPELGDI